MNENKITFSIPNVTARKLIESFQLLQFVPSPATGAARSVTINVTSMQKEGREATVITINLGYLGVEEFSYVFECQIVGDAVVSQLGLYNGSDRNFRCGDIGLFTEAAITGTV